MTDILARAEMAVREFVTRPEFAQLLQEIASSGGMEQRLADQLADQIRAQDTPVRKHWARSEAYVAARPPGREEAKAQALEEVKRTGKVAEASSRHGISRATIYRMLNR